MGLAHYIYLDPTPISLLGSWGQHDFLACELLDLGVHFLWILYFLHAIRTAVFSLAAGQMGAGVFLTLIGRFCYICAVAVGGREFRLC